MRQDALGPRSIVFVGRDSVTSLSLGLDLSSRLRSLSEAPKNSAEFCLKWQIWLPFNNSQLSFFGSSKEEGGERLMQASQLSLKQLPAISDIGLDISQVAHRHQGASSQPDLPCSQHIAGTKWCFEPQV